MLTQGKDYSSRPYDPNVLQNVKTLVRVARSLLMDAELKDLPPDDGVLLTRMYAELLSCASMSHRSRPGASARSPSVLPSDA